MTKVLLSIFSTDESTTRLVQRLVLAGVFLPHGAQKLLGWFGGGVVSLGHALS